MSPFFRLFWSVVIYALVFMAYVGVVNFVFAEIPASVNERAGIVGVGIGWMFVSAFILEIHEKRSLRGDILHALEWFKFPKIKLPKIKWPLRRKEAEIVTGAPRPTAALAYMIATAIKRYPEKTVIGEYGRIEWANEGVTAFFTECMNCQVKVRSKTLDLNDKERDMVHSALVFAKSWHARRTIAEQDAATQLTAVEGIEYMMKIDEGQPTLTLDK